MIDEGGGNSGRKNCESDSRLQWIYLLFNPSSTTIVGVDQKAYCFWLTVKESYNNYCGHLQNKG